MESNKLPNFQIFGSENSKDYDVLVFVDNIPQVTDDAHQLCKYYNNILEPVLNDKPLNCNIGVIQDGQLVDCFKGTVDELQNVLYYTYKNHKQYYPNFISHTVERDLEEKILRVCRCILSFYSRTSIRPQVKLALRSDLRTKIPVLKMINFVDMSDFTNKRESVEDIYKVIAFQFGQLFSLIDGHEKESYTKNEIIKNYSDLEPFLNRKSSKDDLPILNKYKDRLIKLIESKIDTMKKLFEKE
jgi:hypothetical protein